MLKLTDHSCPLMQYSACLNRNTQMFPLHWSLVINTVWKEPVNKSVFNQEAWVSPGTCKCSFNACFVFHMIYSSIFSIPMKPSLIKQSETPTAAHDMAPKIITCWKVHTFLHTLTIFSFINYIMYYYINKIKL